MITRLLFESHQYCLMLFGFAWLLQHGQYVRISFNIKSRKVSFPQNSHSFSWFNIFFRNQLRYNCALKNISRYCSNGTTWRNVMGKCGFARFKLQISTGLISCNAIVHDHYGVDCNVREGVIVIETTWKDYTTQICHHVINNLDTFMLTRSVFILQNTKESPSNARGWDISQTFGIWVFYVYTVRLLK